MARENGQEQARDTRRSGLAAFTIALLASVVGFTFAGTGLRAGPPSEVRDQAAETVAVRLALGGDAAPPLALAAPAPEEPSAAPQQLIADQEQVRLSGAATRVRVSSVGIDADVRSVGLTFRNGALEYDTPRHEAGQYIGSVDPGQSGNLVIGGHVANRGAAAVFEGLPDVAVGAVIEVFNEDRVFSYRVTELRVVSPHATSVMGQTDHSRLTLITCYPERNFQDRLVVVAELL